MEVVQYKCPNCNANIEFNAEKQGFSCEYCMSFFTEEDIKNVFSRNEGKALDSEAQKKAEEFEAHTNLYSCPNCGAEIMSEETTSATFCVYCHNPVILSGRLSGDFRPSKLIPFKIDRENSVKLFKAWCKKKWFLPTDFQSEQQIEKITGLYVPFWIADCNVDADMRAIGKVLRSWSTGNYRYTETKEFSVSRHAIIDFDGIPADGASKIDDKLMEAIEPFDYSELEDFSMSYLSGFFANKYDVDKAGVFPRVRNRAANASDQLLRSSAAGYSTLSVTSSCYNVLKTDWQYMLLPVWFMNYKYKGKIYSFVINGQSGKLAGIPPLSFPKLLAFCGGVFALAGIISSIVGWLAV